MNKRTPLIHRRTQYVGVLSDGMWSAHSRAAGANGVPATAPLSALATEHIGARLDIKSGTIRMFGTANAVWCRKDGDYLTVTLDGLPQSISGSMPVWFEE